ncbi:MULTISPECIES: hypothetical protein [unclassified Streptomyces]|uniref:hypothetical protein n=1 Tax=unclassified Streptomyces TaxID=2593676 RepID=UPI002E761368|nr:hypothetical protein [Streptomyces sp. JV184]MEE1744213.1 hypothetical protein [Streptomyces sp. JV184]
MIEPGGIPQYTGDFGQLEKAASGLRTHATGIRNGGKDVHSRFQATAAYYKAPEAEKLFSSTQPVMDTADEFATDIESLADALDTFIHEAKPHADRLEQLKLDAIGFVDSVRGDDDWTEDQKKTDAHQALMDDVAAACAAFQEAERSAANKIGAISPGACRPAWIVDDGTHGLGMYGQNADTLKGMEALPWGSPEGRAYERWSLEWWGHGAKSWAWDGLVKDSIWGGLDGLGTLVGFHGGEARDQAWDGLRRTAVGGYAYGMDLFGQDEHLSDWQRDSKAYAKEFGKQFIAYDMANEDPARAHAVLSFNILTLATGPFAAAAKLGKGGTIAKAAGTMAKIGDALDPLSGTFKAAKALSDLPKVSRILANVSDHLQIPKTKFPDGAFDLSDRYRVDKDGRFVPLDLDGKPDLAPARHEPSAAERGTGRRDGNHEPVGVGGRAPGATAHAGDGLPPRGSHDAGSGQSAGTAPHGPGGEGAPAAGGQNGPKDGHDAGPGEHSGGGSHSGEAADSSHGDAVHVDTPAVGDGVAGPGHVDGDHGIDPLSGSTGSGPMKLGGEAERQFREAMRNIPNNNIKPKVLEKIVARMGEYPQGREIADIITSGHLSQTHKFRDVVSMLGSGVRGQDLRAMDQIRLGDQFYRSGLRDIEFEIKNQAFKADLDVRVTDTNGESYGYQMKRLENPKNPFESIAKADHLGQLSKSNADHRIMLVDGQGTIAEWQARGIPEELLQVHRGEHALKSSKGRGILFVIRLEDGTITIPPGAKADPRGVL